jgi:hypothetical protein
MNRRQLVLSTTTILTVGISGCTTTDDPQVPHCEGTAPPTIFNGDNQQYDIDILIEKDGESILTEEYSVSQSNGEQIDVELEAETTYSVTINLSGTEYNPQQIEIPNGSGLAINIEDGNPTVDTYPACD